MPAGRGCSGVSQRTATHFSSLSGDSEGALTFGACRPPDHAAGVPDFCQPRHLKGCRVDFFCVCTCQRDGDRAGSKVAVFLPLPPLFEY